ncbi:MAG TPA: DUF2452 domain-containing protein [Saprospiraceae bacterium]|nr:DUF2452 domain-containing protein [Saprospiraceae bacterium]HNT21996.1 DUF2452 domain-containing protein [Saprospiraceae bacterium]
MNNEWSGTDKHSEEFINPVDKTKVTSTPGSLPYPHHAGSALVRPEDMGKVQGLALQAMYQQTDTQLQQIREQIELLLAQGKNIQTRIQVSEQIYQAAIGFDPVINHIYHLYQKKSDQAWALSMVAPHEWGRKKPYEYLATVRLLADHTWEILKTRETDEG